MRAVLKPLLGLTIAIIFIRPSIPFIVLDIEYWLYLIIVVLLIWNTKLYNKDIIFFLAATPFLLYVLFMFGYGQFDDMEMVRRLVRSLIDVFICILIFKVIYKNYGFQPNFIYKIFFFAALIQAFVMLSQYIFVWFDDITGLIVHRDQSSSILMRASGFQNRGGDGLSFNQVLGAFAGFYLYKNTKKLKFLTGLFFIVLISLLTARAGFVAFILLMGFIGAINFLFFLFSLRIKAKIFAFTLTIFLVIAFSIPYILNQIDDVSRGYNDPITRAMEPFRNYIESQEFTTKSSEALLGSHLIIPEEAPRLLFGSGQFGLEGSEKVYSDIGYIRTIFGSGVFGLGLSLLPFLVYFFMGIKKPNQFLILILLYGFICHYKIIYLYTGSFLVFLTFTYLLSVYSNNNIEFNKIISTNGK